MSLFVASLNSGSNGNCYYVGNQQEGILIDAGISCRETEQRLKRLELSIRKIKAIFITHEHSDHIYGLQRLSKKHHIPIYITANTLQQGRIQLREDLARTFTAHESIAIGKLSVTAFPIYHDACDPHSFVITDSEVSVGVFTDIGTACANVRKYFAKCHAAFLEANYDEVMLNTGRYSIALKNRIRGGRGHLSNIEAAQLFKQHKPAFMSHLFLSHLSEENNSPEIAAHLFKKVAGKTEIIVASRYEETQVYQINPPGLVYKPKRQYRDQFQLSLFQ